MQAMTTTTTTTTTMIVVIIISALILYLLLLLWHWVVRDLTLLLWNAPDHLHDYCAESMKKRGGTYVFKGPWLSKFNFVVTSDHRNARHIFSRNSGNYVRGEDFRNIFEPLGDGIFNVDGASWKYQRQLLHSVLNNNNEFEGRMMATLKEKMVQTLFLVLDHHVSSSGPGTEVVDIQDVVKRFMFDHICLLVLGFDPGCLDFEGGIICSSSREALRAGKACDEMAEAVAYRHIVPIWVLRLQNWLQVGSEKKMSESWRVMDQFLYQCIKNRKRALANNNNNNKNEFDLLSQCLVAADDGEGGEEQSDKFLRDTALTLILAGKETISSALVWFLWLVATHPRVEQTILDEMKKAVAREAGRSSTAAASGGGAKNLRLFWSKEELMTSNKLVYLHAAICETLRLYPPVPFQHRCAVEEDVLPSGHRVRKGARVIFAICSMGGMEEIWGKDCKEFKPERWIDSVSGGTILPVPSHKFMTFMTGPRSCLGKNMSFLLLKSMASAILWNYKLEVVEGHPVKPALSVIMSMKYGLKMRVSKREEK